MRLLTLRAAGRYSRDMPHTLSRRKFCKTAMLGAAAPAAIGAAARRKPNIIYVFADQLRADVVGCYGGHHAATPNIDRMAREGSRLTNCISTWPVCTPYRGMMMSGRYPMRNGCVTNTVGLLDGLPTIGTVCRDNGYATGYIGKWHMENDRVPFVPKERRHGFDFWAVRNCDHVYFNSFYCADTPRRIPLPGWEPAAQTKVALDYIRRHQDKPFCLILSWGPPHDPYVAPERYKAMFPKESLRFRGNVHERKFVDDLLAAAHTDDPQALKVRRRDRPILDSDERLMDWWQAYLAMTRSLDDCVGQLLRQLDESGIADDTIFVFGSDHGDMMGSHRMAYKQMPFEESLRVPFVVRYPRGVKRGIESDALFAPIDVMPTLLGLAGLPIPEGLDGRDFQAALNGRPRHERDALLIMKMMPGGSPWFVNGVKEWRGVRTKTHTYVRSMSAGPWLLFDNIGDPLQLKNLIHDPASGPLCAAMEKRMAELMKEAGDPGDTAAIRKFMAANRRKNPPRRDGGHVEDAG